MSRGDGGQAAQDDGFPRVSGDEPASPRLRQEMP